MIGYNKHWENDQVGLQNYRENALKNFTKKNWYDVYRYKMFLLKEIGEDTNTLNKFYDLVENQIENSENKLEIENIIQKAKMNNYDIIMTEKDYFKFKKFPVKQFNYLKVSLEIENSEKKIEIVFEEIKITSIKKNYFILLSILSQILSLLFLLLLFRSFLLKTR